MKDSKKFLPVLIAGVALLFFAVVLGSVLSGRGGTSDTQYSASDSDVSDVNDLPDEDGLAKLFNKELRNLTINEKELIKAPVDLGDTSVSALYDELPEIDKYPLVVEGRGDIDIEIFTSGEKAGDGTDNWLVEIARRINDSHFTISDGSSVSVSVRSVSSGLGADYCISGKYYPDLWTPSNEIFGEYAIQNKAKIELLEERIVGNTAGILVKKDSGLTSLDAVIDTVISGSLNMGYTNPQTSGAGINLLIEMLKSFGGGEVDSEQAVSTFVKFNNNIPYIAFTTQQMRDSAIGGTFDCVVTEYQAYINDQTLVKEYDFIPYGVRHDNPLYIVNKSSKSEQELEAIDVVVDFLLNAESQEYATKCGFNANNDYQSSYEVLGSDVVKALDIYKNKKDGGRDVIAVFVADCSGSMDGDKILGVKNAISNGMKYINENNYVGLVSFNSEVNIEVPIAKFDLTQMSYFQGAINNMDANGGTSTYSAIAVALDMIRNAKEVTPDAKTFIILLSDGQANEALSISKVESVYKQEGVPIYSIGYGSGANFDELNQLSSINEADVLSADEDDIVYKIKSLFNAQL